MIKTNWFGDIIGWFILAFAVKSWPYKPSAAGMAVSSCHIT